MDDAVDIATNHAMAGDTILLAPGCASFDMFDDYAARGTAFASAVRSLNRRTPTGGAR
jgi:UDP-N-acetylmuramoylalanine--D-glutamate ligase